MIRSHRIIQKAKMFYYDTRGKVYSTTVWVWASRAVVQKKKKTDNEKMRAYSKLVFWVTEGRVGLDQVSKEPFRICICPHVILVHWVFGRSRLITRLVG